MSCHRPCRKRLLDGRLTISVPIQMTRRSGRKLVTLANGEAQGTRPWDGELTLCKPVDTGGLPTFESREVRSLREIARKEGVDSSYVRRMANLTTLALGIVAAILDETPLHAKWRRGRARPKKERGPPEDQPRKSTRPVSRL